MKKTARSFSEWQYGVSESICGSRVTELQKQTTNTDTDIQNTVEHYITLRGNGQSKAVMQAIFS